MQKDSFAGYCYSSFEQMGPMKVGAVILATSLGRVFVCLDLHSCRRAVAMCQKLPRSQYTKIELEHPDYEARRPVCNIPVSAYWALCILFALC